MSSPIAHASAAILGKSVDRKAPIWLFILAAQIPDLLFFLFQFIGLERQADVLVDLVNGYTYLSQAYIPWSHGLFMNAVWSVAVALAVCLIYRRFRVGVLAGAMVLSHWLLDFIVYDNLPLLFKESHEVGLGLVKSPVGVKFAVAIEVIGVAGILIYAARYFLKKKKIKKPDVQGTPKPSRGDSGSAG